MGDFEDNGNGVRSINYAILVPMPDFPSMIALMILGALGVAWWNAARAANERATALGRAACERAGVIWLDQTVHACGLRLYRRENGRLGLERQFRFEYSFSGHDRHPGQLVLHGNHLVSLVGPPPPDAIDHAP